MICLRPRQKTFVEQSIRALNEHHNTLAVAATGFGKSVCLSAVVNQQIQHSDKKACVLAHRDELIFQNRQTFCRLTANDECTLSTSLINAQEKSWAGNVTFAMAPSLCREAQLQQMPSLDLLVIDEAHHAIASSYVRIINHAKSLNPDLQLYGVTASPMRGDGRGLRPLFSNIADQVSIAEVIRDGHLVPPKTFVIDVGVQERLSRVKRTMDDFDLQEVAFIMDRHVVNEAVVSHWKEKAGNRKTIVFCSTVDHAHHVCEHFLQENINAAVIHGGLSPKERQSLLYDFDHGELQVLLNCFVLTEGFDSQPVSCVVLLRPSSYKSTLIQCVGRGLRTVDPEQYPGVTKTDCVVLDFGISTLLHGSLEQTVTLKDDASSSHAPTKTCPDCGAEVPTAVKHCVLCGYEWPRSDVQGKTDLVDFAMPEVDVLNSTVCRWCDVLGEGVVWMATGFDAWAGALLIDEQWYAIGGGKRQRPQLILQGERTLCVAAADQWLVQHEGDEAVRKSRRWQEQSATPQQLNFLPPQYRRDFGLTRYQASCLLAYRFHQRAIAALVAQASFVAREVVCA